MKKIIILTDSNKNYLGKITFGKDQKIFLEPEDENNRQFLEIILKNTLEKGLKKRGSGIKKTKGKKLIFDYLENITKNAPFYLEILAENIQKQGLLAFVLNQDQAEIYVLVKKSMLSQDQKLKIICNLKSLSKDQLLKIKTCF